MYFSYIVSNSLAMKNHLLTGFSLILSLLGIFGQKTISNEVTEIDKQCSNDEICIRNNNCPSFVEQRKQMVRLEKDSFERKKLFKTLRGSVCNKSERGVCCSRCDGGDPCLSEAQCPHAQDLRRRFRTGDEDARREFISLICDKKERTFCCPNQTTNNNRNYNNQVKSPAWLPGEGECGRPGRPGFIVGGEATSPGEFPFTALLGYTHTVKKWVEQERAIKTWNETKYDCGGTLINHWYVVTAAHCIYERLIFVRLGEWETLRDPDCDGSVCLEKVQDIGIEHKIRHESYRITHNNVLNDVALIKLSSPAVLNHAVQIVCLPVNSTEAARLLGLENLGSGLVGKRATVVGWGHTQFNPFSTEEQGDFEHHNIASTSQQKLDVPVLSSTECTQKFGRGIIPEDSQICAGGEPGKDSCKVKIFFFTS